jgi:AcrR family transcriptional regulator
LSTSARPDRRVLKTRRALHDALVAVIRDRDYEDISIQEILDRANVGRSTFYMHYRDKDELLVSGIHDMIQSVSPVRSNGDASSDDLTWFSLPILEHHERHRRSVEHRLTGSARAVLHEHLRHVLTGLVRDRVRRLQSLRRRPHAPQIPPGLLAPYISSTFVLVLNWWLDTRAPLGARDVHDLFRALVSAGAPDR